MGEGDLIYFGLPNPGGTAASCKQGNKQPVASFTIPVKEWWQEDACKFNQRSNSCLPTIRYNTQEKYKKTYTGHWGSPTCLMMKHSDQIQGLESCQTLFRVPSLCPPNRLLGPAFPVVVPRFLACLILPTRSSMTRFPFLVCMPLPPLSVLPVLLLPRLPTVMMKFPFHVSHTVLLWFRVSVMSSFLSLALPPSPPLLFLPQPAPHAGGRRRCPLGYGEYRFASSSLNLQTHLSELVLLPWPEVVHTRKTSHAISIPRISATPNSPIPLSDKRKEKEVTSKPAADS
jgi:hypothetical protein